MSAPSSALRRHDLRPLAAPVVLLLAWAAVGRLHAVDPLKLPTIPAVAAALRDLLAQGKIFGGLQASLLRAAAGFGVALAAGVATGALLGLSRWADRIGGPTFHAARQVAPFAWLPLIGAAFGTGEAPKIAFVAVTAYPFVAVSACQGVRALSRDHVELARILEIGRWRFCTHLLAPAAAPDLLAGTRVALATAWMAVIGAEFFLAVAPGVGAILMQGRMSTRMDLVLIGVGLAGLVGLLLDRAFGLVERALLRWRPPPRL